MGVFIGLNGISLSAILLVGDLIDIFGKLLKFINYACDRL